ncbi:RDD family protein [Microlunatus sp. Gsoil 973]|uniref:RDD family protein n=1 Tax=Microlunatus sp. Gsoil 973 TaxID=2672569 RepID=UPI001E5336CE|nr:RDD family protein [Microlunatus sp. Gsoil 973]
MERHPWRRLLGWLIDWCCILVWAAVLAAIAVPLYRGGLIPGLSSAAGNLVATAVLVIPVTLGLAGLESRRGVATIGKRVTGLRVTTVAGVRPGFGRAVARNGLKITVPWLIGHADVYALVASSDAAVPGWLWVLTAAAYILPTVWIVSLFIGSGRTPYDRIAGTTVRATGRAATTRRGNEGITDPSARGGAG